MTLMWDAVCMLRIRRDCAWMVGVQGERGMMLKMRSKNAPYEPAVIYAALCGSIRPSKSCKCAPIGAVAVFSTVRVTVSGMMMQVEWCWGRCLNRQKEPFAGRSHSTRKWHERLPELQIGNATWNSAFNRICAF